jgi:hypothetical protein
MLAARYMQGEGRRSSHKALDGSSDNCTYTLSMLNYPSLSLRFEDSPHRDRTKIGWFTLILALKPPHGRHQREAHLHGDQPQAVRHVLHGDGQRRSRQHTCDPRVGQSVDVDLSPRSVRRQATQCEMQPARRASRANWFGWLALCKPPRGCQFDHGDVDHAGQ